MQFRTYTVDRTRVGVPGLALALALALARERAELVYITTSPRACYSHIDPGSATPEKMMRKVCVLLVVCFPSLLTSQRESTTNSPSTLNGPCR